MLKTRLWMGSLLIGLGLLILCEERWSAPWYPLLIAATCVSAILGAGEFCSLLDPGLRPNTRLCQSGIVFILLANLATPAASTLFIPAQWSGWPTILLTWATGAGALFALEFWQFTGPRQCVPRLALALFVLFYLGILPSFLLQIRWLPPSGGPELPSRSTWSLALVLFVTKGGDIGAYFTGKFLAGPILGKHALAPRLSPKKTWEGLIGGLLTSVAIAWIIVRAAGAESTPLPRVIAFGLTVGIAGVFGDLAESLIKRDCHRKDASATLPGFGGVLDLIDSLLGAAPVAYLWLGTPFFQFWENN